ncbi:response regulator protein [Rhizobium gallicum]|uniref:Response regulator protein n=1 Tax=Rhizobium gallicum TaxID=56730 RepID=A0A1L5NKS4_9HYPH|nr:winged helix-turn-helix domain-containing protein [Rhizobium gallicum]APO68487.1 response regulator protein [Rhizobium gallicum]
MDAETYSFGSFIVDPAAGIVERDGIPVTIGGRGVAILCALLEAGGGVVSKDVLLGRAWPNLTVGEANLSVQIAGLRKALGPTPEGGEWIVTVPRIGYRFPASKPDAVVPDGTGPLLAILPFENLSADGVDAYFVDGVVEDIITALSGFTTFSVLSRSASFALRERARDLQVARCPVPVRYLLTGNMRRRGDRLRLTVRLIGAESGRQLWAERFEGDTDQLFQFQDYITEAVAGLVEPGIKKAEIERVRRKPPMALDAYEFYLQALPYFRGTSESSRIEAIRLLEKAVACDDGFSIGLAHAAWAYERQDTFGSGMSDSERNRALQLAERALLHGMNDPLVDAICALVFLNIAGEVDRSLAMLAEAERRCPHNSTVLSLFAFANVMVGDVEAGRQGFLRALKIAPGALDNYELLVGVAIARLFQGEFEDSISWSLRSIAQNGEWLGAYWMLIASYVQLGRIEQARTIVGRLLARAPGMRVPDIERLGRRYAERFQVVIDAMRSAGLPE